MRNKKRILQTNKRKYCNKWENTFGTYLEVSRPIKDKSEFIIKLQHLNYYKSHFTNQFCNIELSLKYIS